MVLAMNIGNTNFVFVWKKNDNIVTVRHSIAFFETREDFISFIKDTMKKFKIKPELVKGVVFSSVIPELTILLEDSIEKLFNVKPLIVSHEISMDLNLDNYDKTKLGNDRIAICEYAIKKYDTPLIIFDFGTATTINVITNNNCFLGGSILTGITMGLNALNKNTAQLKKIEIEPNTKINIIGENSEECLISGAIYGNSSMLDGMVCSINKFLGQNSTVLVTGGNAIYILDICKTKIIHEPDLLAKGLYCLYSKNMGE